MCGIAGMFAYTADAAPVDETELLAMREAMVRRGPDGAGLWMAADRRVGLAHRRLAIIDLSEQGAQPMQTSDGRFVITFNGEIYNYRALRERLLEQGVALRSTSDTEVLLELYARRGLDMLPELRGMYAFAIWDAVERTLLLARDPFGIKPLYYADDGAVLRFASQVKALLAGGGVDTSPEPAGHTGFFLWGHVPDPFTLYRGIRALPAGHYLLLKENQSPLLKSFRCVSQMLREAERQAVKSGPMPLASLRAVLAESVQHHLVADVPVGVFLSSGIDSTTLAAAVAEQGGDLRTVTLGFEEYRGTADDEVPLAEAVARQYGAQHQTIWVPRQAFLDELEPALEAMDQPSIDGLNTYHVSRVTAAAGLKVALSGLGGDEVFGGYPSFHQIPQTVRRLAHLPGLRLLGPGFRVVSLPFLRRFTSPKYAGLLEYGQSYGGAYLLRRGLFMPWELPELLDPDFVRAGWDRLHTLSALAQSVAGMQSGHRKVAALELNWYMRHQLLRDTDWASMAHSLEVRVPFVDLGLLRAVAPYMDSGRGLSKTLLSQTPCKPLPEAITRRSKTGFTVPIRQWLLENQQVQGERGLRGWARWIYQQCQHAAPRPNALARAA